jgi:small subunit ribosomal protein S6
MTRPYEAVYILDSTLEDTAINEKLARFQELLGNPADLTVDHWGRRQFAYQIGRKDTGYYVVSRFTADPLVLPEYERALRLDEGVVRYLLSLHERETGAPPMSEEDMAAAARRRDDDDDED